MEKFHQALGLESLTLFLGVSNQDPHPTAMDGDEYDKRVVAEQLDLAFKVDSVTLPGPIHLAITAMAEVIPMPTSAE